MIGARVLLIDDDPVMRLMTRHQLDTPWIELTDVSSGDEAVQNYRPEDFDVIICDLEMPGISGLDVYLTWAAESSTPFVLMTGYLEEAELSVEGMHAYLSKPVATKELIKVVESALAANRLHLQP